tara:strand:+ start:212 stop:574 length:363 start_codon:yes stop_codon:yes gene_type:complete
MADLNKLRQNNPHWQPEDGDRDYQEELDKASAEGSTKYFPEECPLDPIEEAKILIVNKITKHFNDYLFEMVNEEMHDQYVFQVDNYLTTAGYDEFEEAWFEFYHEHHGDILYDVMKNITN